MTELLQQVINLVNEGKTVSEIARILGKNTSSVSSVVKRFNLHPKKVYENTVKDDFFDIIDTEEKAYLLGFFIADGCINKTTKRSIGRFSINQSIDDIEIVRAFKDNLNIPNNIQYVDNQSGVKKRKILCRIRWTSKHMMDIMNNIYGITSNKTLDSTFSFPLETIPVNLLNHFVRGFIDGDGYMGDNGAENNFSVSVVSTSEKFITQIGDLISNATNMSYKIYSMQGKTCIYYSLRWSCDRRDKLLKITKLKNYLYTDATVFLSRKKYEIDRYIEYRANQLNNIN